MIASFAATVVTVTLPARFFSWRFRGNSLTLAHDGLLQQSFDLIVATSMTDLSALKGMAPQLAMVPTVLYFHENQFAYPDANQGHQLERQMTSIYSAVSADRLVFNSRFNMESFLQGLDQLLKKMPDGVPAHLTESLSSKSRVISVPIDSPSYSEAHAADARPSGDVLSLVWNHRWEYDKGLDELVQLVGLLVGSELRFKFHLIGQQFRNQPQQIDSVCELLGDALGVCGHIEQRQDYLQLLASSDMVLSTARQEFQGIAVLEAVAAGCVPVVPDSLAYQEYIPGSQRYGDLAGAVKLVREYVPALRGSIELPDSVKPARVQAEWQKLVAELV